MIHCSKLGSSGSLFFFPLVRVTVDGIDNILTTGRELLFNFITVFLHQVEFYWKEGLKYEFNAFFFLVSIPLPSVRPHSTPLRLIKSFAFVDCKSISSHFWLMVHFETGQSRPQTLANSPKADFFRNWNHMKCKLYDANRITLTICTSA